MSATNDTPLKRFMAFWVVLGAFLLFGIIALFLAPLANSSEVTAADEAGAKRRLAVRELVEAEQLKNLSRVESGNKIQVPPSEVFSLVGKQLAASKAAPVKDDKFRDPAAATEASESQEETQEASATEAKPTMKAESKEVAPVAAPKPKVMPSKPAPTKTTTPSKEVVNPALNPRAPRIETRN